MKKFSVKMRYITVVLAIVFAVCAMSGCAKRETNLKSTPAPEPSETVPMDGEDVSFTLPPTYEPEITPDYNSGRQQAQNFTVKDKDGKEVELASLIGKPIIITFFATWVEEADISIKYLQEVYDKYSNDCHFLIITAPDGYNETVENITKFMKKQKISVPVYFDTDSAVFDAYGITNVPQVYYIDSQGMIAGVSANLGVPEMMGARIEMLLSE